MEVLDLEGGFPDSWMAVALVEYATHTSLLLSKSDIVKWRSEVAFYIEVPNTRESCRDMYDVYRQITLAPSRALLHSFSSPTPRRMNL